ncbi:MAG: phospho-N-acetylmuramoyl-pentapeptide-transferase [Bacteroidales bacterium]|jgi:phospho-N-acetylmuramoyl-pentapeptide-transferase|nr:phospho-N-acetylmuramoyl-pentapeptide-transferase [Bacteroidales bacterium]MDD2687436.1 phospho-N-acetylmuramoyl-pentapeptide-transferase [Bacteroidales bacterium]MDD3330640.1 phospho-N-acetylmuramoyl-pentapeptide-transferase [Bacteroidales bacterium]MDD3691571.1 phospho-N-acetylmuramoyl-pentapeptide-transferase [Bacteroidales bacterium]MDD4045013.1 phospho-N-acetylmuramoyl-pentapeptide-transferase [Bacteroidales bacterium]
MLYNLFTWLDNTFDFPGAGVFQYISFRMAMATLLSLFLSMIIGKYIIHFLQKKQIGEEIRNLGLAGQMEKKGTPTMGGIIILSSILISVLLFNQLNNIYILLMVFTTVWLGVLGFMDDYIKVFKKNKQGLSSKMKLIGQSILGLVVALVLFFHPDVVIKEKCDTQTYVQTQSVFQVENSSAKGANAYECVEATKSTKTTIPFVKNNEFDYSVLLKWLGNGYKDWTWLIYIPIIIFIIVAVSNGANLTDGLDGLAIVTTAIIGATLGIFAYVSGNTIFADYLNIMYIPDTGELMIFTGALIGACLGFYWWNCYPAQVFMGDTGSLALGGIIAVFAIIIRKELLIPILCGIYFVQSLSVVLQIYYFKYTKKKYGEGKRLFLMAPIHHHYQKKGWHESKIVQRFVIVGIILAVLSVITLKLR